VAIRTQNEQISATLAQEKTFSTLTTGFGLLALILASIGIYGIMAYNVARRVNEIGIRMALGAQSGQIRAMILREGVLLAIAGILLGVAATLPLTRLVATMLYGVSPTDPLTLIGATVILLAIALLAAFLPARKASVIDPTVALRHE
jgi:ABC-type antimicrobial peptide transport system permease subunit